jgi:hypothetical protein
MFKIGDNVEVIQGAETESLYWDKDCQTLVGKVGQIIAENYLGNYELDISSRLHFDAKWLKPATNKAVKAVKQKPWREIARYLAEFNSCDGDTISWRKIAKMIGVPKSTTSDFLRNLRKQGVLG